MEDCSHVSFNISTDDALQRRGLPYLVLHYKSLKDYDSYIQLPRLRQWGVCMLEGIKIYEGLRSLGNATSFRVGINPLHPYIMKTVENNKETLHGFLIDLWNTLEDWLKFNSKYTQMEDDVARKLLADGEIDVYLHPNVVLPEEFDMYDYTIPIGNLWYQLFIKQPRAKVSGGAFVRALSPGMWLMTVVALIIFSLALRGTVALRLFSGADSGLERSEPTDMPSFRYVHLLRRKQEVKIEKDLQKVPSAGSCFLSILGCLCSQGLQDQPETGSLRLLCLSALVFGLMVYNAYAAVLVSYLATGTTHLPFRGLQHAGRVRTHSICVRPRSYASTAFDDPVTQQMLPHWRGLVNRHPCLLENKPIKKTEDDSQSSSADNASVPNVTWNAIETVCSGRGAVLENPSVVSAIAIYFPEDCHLVPIGEKILPSVISILLRADFAYTGALDRCILKLREVGLLDYMERKWFGAKAHPTIQTGTDFVSSFRTVFTNHGIESDDSSMYVQVTIGHVGSVLIAYAGCLLVPVAILLIEIVVHKVRSRKKRTKPQAGRCLINKLSHRAGKLLFRQSKEPKLLRP